MSQLLQRGTTPSSMPGLLLENETIACAINALGLRNVSRPAAVFIGPLSIIPSTTHRIACAVDRFDNPGTVFKPVVSAQILLHRSIVNFADLQPVKLV
jgi:hypothetical protein